MAWGSSAIAPVLNRNGLPTAYAASTGAAYRQNTVFPSQA